MVALAARVTNRTPSAVITTASMILISIAAIAGMKIVPVLSIAAIIWILAQASASQTSIGNDTRAGLRLAAEVLVIASIFYFVHARFSRKS